MACHTWVYANGIEIPKEIIDGVPERVRTNNFIIDICKLLLETFQNNIEDVSKDISLLLGSDNNLPNGDEIVTKKLTEYDISKYNSLDVITNFHNYLLNNISYYHKLDKTELVKQMLENLEEDRLGLDENALEELLDEYLMSTGKLEVYMIKDGKYYLQVDIHDPFRVYKYGKECYSKEELLTFLIDIQGKDDVSMRIYSPDLGKEVSKVEDYREYKKLVKAAVDKIYDKYPDAIVDFG